MLIIMMARKFIRLIVTLATWMCTWIYFFKSFSGEGLIIYLFYHLPVQYMCAVDFSHFSAHYAPSSPSSPSAPLGTVLLTSPSDIFGFVFFQCVFP